MLLSSLFVSQLNELFTFPSTISSKFSSLFLLLSFIGDSTSAFELLFISQFSKCLPFDALFLEGSNLSFAIVAVIVSMFSFVTGKVTSSPNLFVAKFESLFVLSKPQVSGSVNLNDSELPDCNKK